MTVSKKFLKGPVIVLEEFYDSKLFGRNQEDDPMKQKKGGLN